MPSTTVPIPRKKREDMTSILLQECDAQVLRDIGHLNSKSIIGKMHSAKEISCELENYQRQKAQTVGLRPRVLDVRRVTSKSSLAAFLWEVLSGCAKAVSWQSF